MTDIMLAWPYKTGSFWDTWQENNRLICAIWHVAMWYIYTFQVFAFPDRQDWFLQQQASLCLMPCKALLKLGLTSWTSDCKNTRPPAANSFATPSTSCGCTMRFFLLRSFQCGSGNCTRWCLSTTLADAHALFWWDVLHSSVSWSLHLDWVSQTTALACTCLQTSCASLVCIVHTNVLVCYDL